MKSIKIILILILLIFLSFELFTDYEINRWLKFSGYTASVILVSIELIMTKKKMSK